MEISKNQYLCFFKIISEWRLAVLKFFVKDQKKTSHDIPLSLTMEIVHCSEKFLKVCHIDQPITSLRKTVNHVVEGSGTTL